jgi:hypothetical protein
VAAAGAIRRVPKYAVRVEMGQFVLTLSIALRNYAADMPFLGGVS